MEKEQIIENAIRELTELALQKRRGMADETEQKLLNSVTELSVKLQQILEQISEEEQEILTEYLEKIELIADHDCRHLYMQGAKDCIMLLKTLKII
ncbi:hypothetical protein [Hungatella effluvii]|uniref:hypothetical protein n=1 Tax=Hungatella effluvii TaxID=1096246 RepID=UPI0022E27E1C|nr:hypothetical protein [Hungatella effluvii]